MEEKMFELMSKMYGEMKDMDKRMNEGFKSVNERLDKVEQNQVRFEQEMNRKTDLLLDGYKANYELIQVVDAKLEHVNQRVSNCELGITVIQTQGRKQFTPDSFKDLFKQTKEE